MADGSIKIDTKIDSSGLKSDLKSVTNQIKESFASMRDVMQGPIAAINMIKDALKGMYSATVGNASAIEDMVAAFTPMVDGAENAKKMVAMLNQESATTPYELEGLGGIAKQVLPILGNNVDAVRKSIRMLGDTAGGNIQKLDSITRGYMKTMMKGKVDMESLNMIADAGVPIYDQLAKSMGVSVAQMMKMSTEGKITASDLTNAFEAMTSKGGIFYNGMAIASQTLSGKASSMKDALKQAGSVIGNELLSSVESVIDAVANAANGFTAWAKEGNNLRVALQLLGITAVTASMAALVSAVPSIIAGIVALKGAVLAFSASLMGPMGVVVAIGAVIGALTLLGDARHKAAIKGIEGQFSGLISETGVTAEQIDKIESALGSMGSISTDQLATNVRFLSKELGVSADTIARAGMNSKHLTDEFKAQLEQVRLINAEEAKRRGFSSTDDLLAEKAFYREKAKAEAAKNGTTYSEAQLKIISARIKAEDDYARAVASANQKKSAGLITEEERWKLIQDAAGKYLDTLLDLGYAFDDFKSIGGKALNDMAAILRSTEVKVPIRFEMKGGFDLVGSDLSKEFTDPLSKATDGIFASGLSLMNSYKLTEAADKAAKEMLAQFANSVDENLHKATAAVKRAASNIVLAFTNPLQFLSKLAENALDTLEGIFIKYAKKIIVGFGTTDIGKQFREILTKLKKAIPGWVSDIFDTLRACFDLGIAGFGFFIAGVFSAMSSLAKFDPSAMLTSLQDILAGVTDFFENDLGSLPIYAQSALNIIQAFISGILNNLPALIETAKNVLSFFVKAIIDNGPGIISAAVEIVLGFAKVIIDNLPAIIDAGIKMVIAFIQAIVDNSEMIFTAIANAIAGIIQVITDNLPEIIQAACDLFVALVQGLAIALPIILKAIVKALPDIINALVEAIPMIITAIADAAPEIIQAIIECFPEIVAACVMVFPLIVIALAQHTPEIIFAMWNMAYQIIAGFIQGMVTAGANIWKGICSVFWAVVDAVKSFFGIHSPSTVFSDIGVNIIQGLINGILNAGAGLWDAVKGIFTGLWDFVVEVFKNSFNIGRDFVNGIKDGINSAGGWIKDTAGNIADAAGDAIDDFGDWSGWWASGTESAPPGFAIVGENGPELVQLGGGERIYPAGETASILSGGRGLASIAAGIGSFAGVSTIPSSSGVGSMTIINKISPAPVQIDGRQIAQVVFENLDKCVGAAYGH